MRPPARGAVFVRGCELAFSASGCPGFLLARIGQAQNALAGLASHSTLAKKRGDGAPQGAFRHVRRSGGAFRNAPAFRRSVCGDFCPRGRASGRRRGPRGPPIRQAFARLRRRRVQPFKAVPRSGDGRRPGASRVRGYEPRPRAPPSPVSAASCRNAPRRRRWKEYKPSIRNCQP